MVFADVDVAHRAFNKSLGCGGRVFIQQVFFEGSFVDADADRDVCSFCRGEDLCDPFFNPDVAGVDSHFRNAGVNGCQRIPIIKMDVCDNWHGRAFDQFGQCFRISLFGDGNAHNLCTGFHAPFGLAQCGVNIVGQRGGHRLNRDWGAVADRYVSDIDLPCRFSIVDL